MVTKEESPVAVVVKESFHQSLSPDSTVPASHTDREVSTSVVPEKPSEDGYNWRKYGQKNVKANEYIRSYYKCSYPNCHVKKQVERSPDGRIMDVTYLGNHNHDKPHTEPVVAVPSLLSAQVQTPSHPASAVVEEKPADVPAPVTQNVQPINACETPAIAVAVAVDVPVSVTPPSQRKEDNNENLTPKKRKKVDGTDISPENPGHESRLVVQTVSEVDIVNDGYRWRKYGQKMVKGNPNPRSYYRCSTAGCPVKKHVERASYDPKVVITTYEHQHDHSMPPVRTIVPQSAAPSSGAADSNGVDKSKSEESDATRTTPMICETDKAVAGESASKENDKLAGEPAPKENDKLAVVVSTQSDKLSSDQEVLNKAKNGEHTDKMVKEKTGMQVIEETKPEVTKSEQQLENSSGIGSVDVKPEVLSTEQQRADAVHGTCAKTTTNGRQKTDAEPVNC